MKQAYLFILIFLLSPLVLSAQSLWEVSKPNTNKQLKNTTISYTLNKDKLYKEIQTKLNQNSFSIEVPVGQKQAAYKTFEVKQVFTIQPDKSTSLDKQILSFKGSSKDQEQITLTITPQGIYASFYKYGSYKYLNPKQDNYSVVTREDEDSSGFECYNTDVISIKVDNRASAKTIDDSTLRTYDLAVACTGEYSQFHINQAGANNATDEVKKDVVLAAMVVTIDRVNQVYNNDLAIQLNLIPNNRDLIFLDADTDPYENTDPNQLINSNTSVINGIIGSGVYDLGHVFSTGGGGVAALGSVCTGFKGAGVTGLPNPVGDPYDIDYVAHELGHQFGATHTYNNSCGGNRTDSTAFEPGSGQTIMAYAGICPPNVANNSVPFFHFASLNQISQFVSFGSGSFCAASTIISNTPPQLQNINNYVIPNTTPFRLEAVGTDVDNDQISYTFEQFDNEISTQPPSAFSSDGPNFKYESPTTVNTRYFPNLETILNNQTANTWEVLPSVTRDLLFVITARDNNPNGGQVVSTFSNLNVAPVGPFTVTSQNLQDLSYAGNSQVEITWDVAGTTANGINTTNVDILLSTDGGLNFDTILLSNTENDGTELISIPNIEADNCRLMVKPVDNVYFAINTEAFSINEDLSTNTFSSIDFKLYPNPASNQVNLDFGTQLNQVEVQVFNVQGRLIKEISKQQQSQIKLSTENFSTGIYLVKIEADEGSLIKKLIIE